MNNNKQIIGLIGGMGPFASARFLETLLKKIALSFDAKKDNDFPEIILDSVSVPEFISDTENLPQAKSVLINRTRRMRRLGCNQIALICNTGHILFPELSGASGGRMVSIIEAVREKVINLKMKRVGILATKTTIKTALYKNAFSNTDVTLIDPNKKLLDVCEKVIRSEIANLPAPNLKENLFRLTDRFIKKEQLDAVILGCTELPLAFVGRDSETIIDCIDVLSDKLVDNMVIIGSRRKKR